MFFQIGVSVMRYNTCVFLDFSSRQQALICPSEKNAPVPGYVSLGPQKPEHLWRCATFS